MVRLGPTKKYWLFWTFRTMERSRVPTNHERADGPRLSAQCKAVPREAGNIEEEV